MSAISNNTILADNEPSICIPRVFANIDRKRIHNVFQTIFGPDVVSQIDMVSKVSETGEEYSRVFVHFNKWPKTVYAQQVRQKLLSGDKVKVVYDEPWFWHMSASRVERPQQSSRPREVSAPYIDLGDSSSSSHSAGAGRKMEKRDQRDAPLVPRQVAMKGKGQVYERERREDTRREPYYYNQDQDRERRHQPHQHQQQRYQEDRPYEGDYMNKGNDYYAPDSRRPQPSQYREDYAPRYDSRQRQQQTQQPSYRNKSKVFTPRTPEIKEWTEKEEGKEVIPPPAPMKTYGRRPVLMLADDEADKKTKTSRKLEMDDAEDTKTETETETSS